MDSDNVQGVFGAVLSRDPQVALDIAQIAFPEIGVGPLHATQYVIELVGPRTARGETTRSLLSPSALGALGNPSVFVLGLADVNWAPLTPSDSRPSYDSIALCWDVVSSRGTLSSGSAAQLLERVRPITERLERIPMPLPTPDMIDPKVAELLERRESLDVGVSIGLVGPEGGIPERDVWVQAARMGFDLSPEGEFVWRAPQWPHDLLALASWEPNEVFRLGNVTQGVRHRVIGLGFNLPTSPAPLEVLNEALRAARLLESELQATATDDEFVPLDRTGEEELRQGARLAVEACSAAGFRPGSPAALALFGGPD